MQNLVINLATNILQHIKFLVNVRGTIYKHHGQ